MMGYPQQLYTLPINAHHIISCGVQPPTRSLCDHISATHKTALPPLLTLNTVAISGMVLWSALLTMGVIRPLGVVTAKH